LNGEGYMIDFYGSGYDVAEKLAGSFVPDSYRAIWLQNLFLKFAGFPVLKGMFLPLIGARSIIK
jgi:hypothetical protein